MGLIKTLEWKGYEPEYWFISDIRQDFKLQRTTIGLSLYKDAAKRLIDKTNGNFDNKINQSNLDPQIFLVVVDGVGLSYEEMYDAIKENQTNTFFHDAINELDV